MTRINCIPVQELTDKHLIAEWKEIQRLPKLVLKAQERGEKASDPRFNGEYTMGKGHVVFFYNKMFYVFNRLVEIRGEMIDRGFSPKYPQWLGGSLADICYSWYQDWKPTEKDININRQRIEERLGK